MRLFHSIFIFIISIFILKMLVAVGNNISLFIRITSRYLLAICNSYSFESIFITWFILIISIWMSLGLIRVSFYKKIFIYLRSRIVSAFEICFNNYIIVVIWLKVRTNDLIIVIWDYFRILIFIWISFWYWNILWRSFSKVTVASLKSFLTIIILIFYIWIWNWITSRIIIKIPITIRSIFLVYITRVFFLSSLIITSQTFGSIWSISINFFREISGFEIWSISIIFLGIKPS